MATLDDPGLNLIKIKEAEKKLERHMIIAVGSGAVSKANLKYKNGISKIKNKETTIKSKLDGLSSRINVAIKGKWSKKVQEVSKKETTKITTI